MKNNKTILTTVKETLARKESLTDIQLKRQTRWIATSGMVPVVNGIFGGYINPHCHVQESYSLKHLQSLNS